MNKALFKTVDTRCAGGAHQWLANAGDRQPDGDGCGLAGVPGVSNTAPVAKQIRSQAMAIASTATQDMQRQVKELYREQIQLSGWCGCGQRRWTPEPAKPALHFISGWDQGDSSRPDWPIHPNCRCEALLIDPEDEFWNQTERTVQQIRIL